MAAASHLTDRRRAAAERLSREVSRLLPRLGLTGGGFTVAFEPLASVGPEGAEQVVFVVQLNPGMDPRPLAKAVSGGELSRLMLALKVVLARHDAVPSLIFDEVDQGIGGEVGTRVGEALGRAAERHQVLVITHLPQIAARADRHLRIAKATRQGLATSDVAVLHGEDRIEELARMLGDADGTAARRLARELLSAITA
jgi:DNA repair protein RecN (Recombination protein N)